MSGPEYKEQWPWTGCGTFQIVYHGKWRGTEAATNIINDRSFAGKPSEQEKKQAGDG